MRLLALLLTLTLFASCANVGNSGFYVKLRSTDTLASLSKRYKIPREAILSANSDKDLRAGNYFFIPQNRGILGRHTIQNIMGGRSPANFSPDISKSAFIWPVPTVSRISSQYGMRWGRVHEGIDIPATRGTRIVSTADGLVVYAGSDLGGYGNIVVIGHANGYFSVYAHTHRFFVFKGQRVMKGQVIAQVGSTGRSTGPHLHFEIRYGGKSYNPMHFVSKPKVKRHYAKK